MTWRLRSPSGACTAWAATLCLALSGCATSAPFVVELPQPSVRPADEIAQISDYRLAAVTVARCFERDLGFAPFPIAFTFYSGTRAFESALVAAGHEPALARSASTMSGIGGYRRVLLNEEALDAQSWPSRVGVLAHEMTHSLQYELGGGTRGSSDQWLREGFAEWVSVRVLESLHAISYDDYKRQHFALWRSSRRSKAPRLDDMATFPQWVARAGERDLAPYSQAFLAVDLLIQRHGREAIIRYFRRFATSADRAGNFRVAFGEPLESFEATLTAYLRK